VAALGELPWRRHGRSSSAKPISRYGALSWTGFLPTGAVRFGKLTWGVFNRCGALEQGARQRGSSSDLRRRWWGASRGSSERGRAKWVRRQLQITDVGLLELEKLLTWRGDGKGYLGLASVFHEIPARGSCIYRGFWSMISCVRRTLSPSHLDSVLIGFHWDFWLGKRALFGIVARREEGNDASRWATPGPWLLHAWRGGVRVGPLASAGGRSLRLGRAGLRQSGGRGVAIGSGSASSPQPV
jgi:hypothetical protein